MKSLMIGAALGLLSMSAAVTHAATGTWHRSPAYDVGQVEPAAGNQQPCVMKRGEPCPYMRKGEPCPMEKDVSQPCPMMKPGEDCPMMRK